MWCAPLTPLHLETHFVHTLPSTDILLFFKKSAKIRIISLSRSDKQTFAVIVHTISIIKKIAKDGQSGKHRP